MMGCRRTMSFVLDMCACAFISLIACFLVCKEMGCNMTGGMGCVIRKKYRVYVFKFSSLGVNGLN